MNIKDSLESWDRWQLEAESVPLDAKKLAADVPQSPRRLLTSSLWGHKGRGAVTEMFPRDRVQFFCDGTVDAGLCSFPWSFQEHGEHSEQYRHKSRMSGQVRVHCPRVDWVHCDIGTFESASQLSGEQHICEFALAVC